jgi:protein gp37
MGTTSSIQWTDATWNVARGCTKVDEDCKFCYMYRDSMDNTRYNPLEIVRTKTVFNLPLRLKEPSKIFTSSLTDFFHEAIDGYRNEAWDIIRKCPQHTFQILTKRPERIMEHLPEYWEEIRSRVWLGTSIGSQKSIDRLRDLVVPIQPGVKFLSLEPLHGEIELPLDEQVDFGHQVHDLIDWVIVGGESGNEKGKYRYRPCELEWIENIVGLCQSYGIPVFVKQLGTYLAKKLGLKDRHGGDINEFPEHLRVRQFPFTAQPLPLLQPKE